MQEFGNSIGPIIIAKKKKKKLDKTVFKPLENWDHMATKQPEFYGKISCHQGETELEPASRDGARGEGIQATTEGMEGAIEAGKKNSAKLKQIANGRV